MRWAKMRRMNTVTTSHVNAGMWAPKHLFVLRWHRDALGYDLSLDGSSIVRRHGAMSMPYEPESVSPPLHLTFANLGRQVLDPEEEVDPILLDPSTPFHQRRFVDEPHALLAFVREYGFLGSARWRDDVPSEPLDYISKHRAHLSAFLAFSDEQAGERAAESFNTLVPPVSLRIVRARAGGFRIGLQPESLIAWMWLRIARDFASGVRYDTEPCRWCGQPFASGTPAPGVRRKNSKFCSDNCRKEKWRHDQKVKHRVKTKRREHK